MSARATVVVLGGGFGGLEAAFYLRYKAQSAIDLTLISEQDHFLFKPNTIYIPFGEHPDKLKVPLSGAARRKNIELIVSRAIEIEPAARKVHLADTTLDFDYLVVATGAQMRPGEVPGLAENAVTVWTPAEMLRLRQELGRLTEQAAGGMDRRLLFVVPPNNRCSGPLYELALMTDTWLRRRGVRERIDITWTTYETGYIQAFGPRLNTVVTREFEERGIHGFKDLAVSHVEPGAAYYRGGQMRPFDVLVAFPPYIAKENYGGLPGDDRGFIQVEAESRRVKGQERIFAVGDAADFPIKQAFLALLQADAAADHIAAEVMGGAPALDYEPMSMCVMEELNRATFAQVPLKYTGDPLKPVGVATDDPEHYKVGVSPLWRVGKKVLGLYAPWRFGRGEPFHAGFAWEAMDLGLRVMSRLMAD